MSQLLSAVDGIIWQECFFSCFLSVQSLGFPVSPRPKLGKSLSQRANIFLLSPAAAPATVSQKKLQTPVVALFQFPLAPFTVRTSHRTKRRGSVIGRISRFTTRWLRASDLMAAEFYLSCPTRATPGWLKRISKRSSHT